MNSKSVFTILGVLLLIPLAINTKQSSAIAAADPSQAFGSGSFFFNEEVAFSFNATVKGAPTSGKGTAQFDYLGSGTQVLVKLGCVRIEQGEVTMSGKVTDSNDPDFPRNSNVVFGAIDGEMTGIPGFLDRITPLFVREAKFNCTDGMPLTILRPEEGSITVVP